jgi:hypothetical protein
VEADFVSAIVCSLCFRIAETPPLLKGSGIFAPHPAISPLALQFRFGLF